MLVVLDINLLVSALLSPFGPPARVLDMVLCGDIRMAYDDRLMAEYREVLARPKFSFAPDDVATLLGFIEADGELVTASPLPYDLPFLEVAARADAVLIIGNPTHYPPEACGAISVLTPAEFLRLWVSRS